MKLLPSFQFKSITHRLIAGCIVATFGVYAVSYNLGIRKVETTLLGWMTDLARDRTNFNIAEIEGRLRAVEAGTQAILPAIQQAESLAATDMNASSSTVVPLLQTLVAQNPAVRSAALIVLDDSGAASGLRYQNQATDPVLNRQQSTPLINRCQAEQTLPNQAFWSAPHSQGKASNTAAITYCLPLSLQAEEVANPTLLLAIELSLDWLPITISKQLIAEDEINQVDFGQVFILDPAKENWLIQPDASDRVLQVLPPEQRNTATATSSSLPVPITSNTPTLSLNLPPQEIEQDGDRLVVDAVPATGWKVGVFFPASQFNQFRQQYFWWIIVSMVRDMVLICGAVALLSRLTTRPLRALIGSTEAMARGQLDATLPVVKYRDEVGRLTRSFRRMRDSLQQYIQELKETTAAKQKLESELSIAGQIQRTMLPHVDAALSPDRLYAISAFLQPARMVGGDLYDFFLLDEDRLCLIIGDVADKGVPAALLMARTMTLIRTTTQSTSSPLDILQTVNRELCIDNEECLFVTLFCGVLALGSGQFEYASGGHDPPLLVRDRAVEWLALETGPPLGLYDDAEFLQQTYQFAPNDLILLYTDGITEAMNPAGEFFSEERLHQNIASHPPSSPTRAIRTVQHFYQQFVDAAPQSDDMTLLSAQYRPSSPFAHQEATLMEWRLTVNSELTELERVRQRLNEVLQQESLTGESIEDVQLIVEEVLANIIQYGGNNRTDSRIDLEVRMSGDQLTLVFADGGQPFNPLEEIDDPDLEMDDEARSQGGLGFFLVRELSDRVDYDYCDHKNILTVNKTIAKT